MDWYSSDELEPGKLYVDADSQFCLEYVGSLTARAAVRLPGVCEQVVETSDEFEQVLVFVVRGSHGLIRFYSHTKADADAGYWFISYTEGVPLEMVASAANTWSV